MFSVTKQFSFEAAHFLTGLPEGHKCAQMHGHGYKVEVELQSKTLNEFGFVVDYNDLQPLGDLLDEKFDHKLLNDFIKHPTAENIAKELFRFCKFHWAETVAVRVSETQKTWAEFRE